MPPRQRTLVLLACLLLGCSDTSPAPGDSQETASPPELPGRWEVVSTSGEQSELQLGVFYAFHPDGQLTVGEGPLAAEGTWQREGDRLHLVLAGVAMDVDIRLETDGLTYSIANSDQVFKMKKQPD